MEEVDVSSVNFTSDNSVTNGGKLYKHIFIAKEHY
jgi:hypothetical protein